MKFKKQVNWNPQLGNPYVADADMKLLEQIAQDDIGAWYYHILWRFFGPQGRRLRIPLADPLLNEKIVKFEYNGDRITNFEMESSALAGLAQHLGHKALTCCMVIANRRQKEANSGYKNTIDGLIKKVLERI